MAHLDLGPCCVIMDKLLNLSDEAIISSLPSEGYFKGEFSECTKSMSLVTAEHRAWACDSQKSFAAMCHAPGNRGQLCHVR